MTGWLRMPDATLTEIRFLSPDAFKAWTRCKKQYYFKYGKKYLWPSDDRHFSLGKDVHKLLDYHARGLNCAALLESADDKVRVSFEKLLAHPISHWSTLASEWGFHVPVHVPGAPVWLVGRMDRIARQDGLIWIIDWKTGTGVPKNPEEDWQTRVYLYALLEIARAPLPNTVLHQPDLPAESLRFCYVEVKTGDQPVRLETVEYSEQKHTETRRLLEQHCSAMVVESTFALPSKCPDRYCPYRTVCGIESQPPFA